MSVSRTFGVLLVVVLTAGLAACTTARGQHASSQQKEATAETTKVALGVRKPKHVEVGIQTARQMLSGEATLTADRVDIVACGPAIRALASDGERADVVRQGLDAGIRLKACGVTVERMGFKAERFVDGVEVVPNGFVEILRLQDEEGFESMEL